MGVKTEIADITESQINDMFDVVFDHAPVLIAYMDSEMNFIRVNHAYASVDNKQPQNFIGKNHFDFYPNPENEKIFRQVVETGQAYQASAKPFEYENNPERGISHWDWTLTPVKNASNRVFGLVLTLIDVTDRVNAIEEAKISENKYHDLNTNLEKKIKQGTEQLEQTLTEREVLLKEIHHRVKNNLAMVNTFIRLQKDTLDDASYIEILESCESRIHAMALVHKKLFQSDSLSQIDMKEIVKEIQQANSIPDKNNLISTNIYVDNLSLDMDTAIPCALIINEWFSNTYKHAFNDGERGVIILSMQQFDDGIIKIGYKDNGHRLADDFDIDNANGLGLQLVRIFVDQLHGSLNINSSNSLEYSLDFRI